MRYFGAKGQRRSHLKSWTNEGRDDLPTSIIWSAIPIIISHLAVWLRLLWRTLPRLRDLQFSSSGLLCCSLLDKLWTDNSRRLV